MIRYENTPKIQPAINLFTSNNPISRNLKQIYQILNANPKLLAEDTWETIHRVIIRYVQSVKSEAGTIRLLLVSYI